MARSGGGEGVKRVEEILPNTRSRRVERFMPPDRAKSVYNLRAVDRRRGRAHFLEADGSPRNVHAGVRTLGGWTMAILTRRSVVRGSLGLVAAGHSPPLHRKCAGEDR